MAILFLCFTNPAAVWFLDARSQPIHAEISRKHRGIG